MKQKRYYLKLKSPLDSEAVCSYDTLADNDAHALLRAELKYPSNGDYKWEVILVS